MYHKAHCILKTGDTNNNYSQNKPICDFVGGMGTSYSLPRTPDDILSNVDEMENQDSCKYSETIDTACHQRSPRDSPVLISHAHDAADTCFMHLNIESSCIEIGN